MCGLIGARLFGPCYLDPRELKAMRNRIGHRGPDDEGLYINERTALGHVRLSVLDLSARAAQPMTSSCGRFTIVYNGEIYNHQDLRAKLTTVGRSVRSSGDTEALLEHLAAFGLAKTLPRLEGFFALALWDRVEQRLSLARDRYGIKPLYYTTDTPNEVRFASEIKALLDRSPQADATSLEAMLLGQGGNWGPHTLFRGIRRVEPGEIVTFERTSTPRTERFFRLTDLVDPALHDELRGHSATEILDLVAAELERGVEMRLLSDAPVACLASGGVDSSLIAAMMARRNSATTLYHADVAHDSETTFAERLASHLGCELRVVKVGDNDLIENLAAVTYHNDEPILYHPNSIPFFLVSKLAAKNGVKVLLTGEGSDEHFLGYPSLALRPIIETWRTALRAAQGLAHRCAPRASRFLIPRQNERLTELHRRAIFRFQEELIDLESAEAARGLSDRRERDAQTTALGLAQSHLATLLHRNDRLAMAWGVESRFPFLGHGLVRLAVNLPRRYKLRGSLTLHDRRHPFVTDKWCIRGVAQRFLPADLARRPKMGFPISLADRLRVKSTCFHDGFIADWYGLTNRAVDHMVEHTTRDWIARLLYIEVWGQLFLRERSREDVTRHLHEHITFADTASVRPRSTPAAVRGGRKRLAVT